MATGDDGEVGDVTQQVRMSRASLPLGGYGAPDAARLLSEAERASAMTGDS